MIFIGSVAVVLATDVQRAAKIRVQLFAPADERQSWPSVRNGGDVVFICEFVLFIPSPGLLPCPTV